MIIIILECTILTRCNYIRTGINTGVHCSIIAIMISCEVAKVLSLSRLNLGE